VKKPLSELFNKSGSMAVSSRFECFEKLGNTDEPVYAAISGGADSTALLLLLRKNVKYLCAIHVNHNLRGAESDRDEAFCRELCDKFGVPLDVVSVDVKSFSEETGKSTEEAARDLRYKAFADITGGQALVATAHTADDNAETMLFNFIRGTGLAGLCGIPPIRGNIIRPLLQITREEILQFLADEGQSYVTDSSNNTDDYSRNYIRHKILPLIKNINPSFVSAAERLSEAVSESADYIAQSADIHSNVPILQKQAILEFFKKNSIEPDYRKICKIYELIATTGKAKVEVCKYTYICYDGQELYTLKKQVKQTNSEKYVIKYDETINFRDKQITLLRQNNKIFNQTPEIHKKLTNNVFDCAKIEGDIDLRSRENGDKYVRIGQNYHSKLKTLYNGHLNPEERIQNIVLSDENGIIWVEHFGIAERVKPDTAIYGDICYIVVGEYDRGLEID
jgi:tRNA(Ile)-lysidine synthase